VTAKNSIPLALLSLNHYRQNDHIMVSSATAHRIELLKQELAALQPLDKAAEDALWKKLKLEWNYNSNHIEGNTLTYGETKLLLIFGTTTGDHSKREYDEMEAHDVAVMMVQQWAKEKERTLTEADIRELNRTILVKPFWKEAITPDGQPTRRMIKIGEYKEHPNSVRLPNGEMFEYTRPDQVPMQMQELVNWFRSGEVTDPIVLAAELHHRFICIHPFDDGNGRVARLLVNYVLMLHDLPPLVIKSAEKKQYLTALQKADVGDKAAFHTYIAEQLIWSLELKLKAAKGEDLEEEGDWKKKAAQLERKVKTKPEVIHHSGQVSQRVMNEVYLPFLTACKEELSLFEKFFSRSNWHLYPTNSKIKTQLDIMESLLGTYEEGESFNSMSNRIATSFEKGFYQYHKVLFKLSAFRDNELGVEMSIIWDIRFFDTYYVINFHVGNEMEMKGIGKFVKMIFSGEEALDDVEKTLAKVNYNQSVEPEQIAQWANEVGRTAFKWMEARISK